MAEHVRTELLSPVFRLTANSLLSRSFGCSVDRGRTSSCGKQRERGRARERERERQRGRERGREREGQRQRGRKREREREREREVHVQRQVEFAREKPAPGSRARHMLHSTLWRKARERSFHPSPHLPFFSFYFRMCTPRTPRDDNDSRDILEFDAAAPYFDFIAAARMGNQFCGREKGVNNCSAMPTDSDEL